MPYTNQYMPFTLMIAAVALWILTPSADGLTSLYCSNLNTGADFTEVTNEFQSNGACLNTCSAKYAFAIVQGHGCWCSNYVPGEVTSVSSCNEKCPGYGQETCGSESKDLFGYIALSRSPSGTLSSDPPAATGTAVASSSDNDSSAQASSTASLRPVTLVQTVTASPTVQTDTVSLAATSQTSSSSDSSSPSSASTTDPPSSTWSPTPITSVRTITGRLETITITPTAPPAVTKGNGLGAAKTIGLSVGLGAFVALLIAGFCLWFYRYRRRRSPPPTIYSDQETLQRGPSGTSQMSLMGQMGLTGGNRSLLGEKALPKIRTSNFDGSSYTNGKSPDISSPSSKRASYPRLTDQRLDPHTLWVNQDNGSRTSVKSLRDDHDYSRRVLRVTNADDV